MISLMSVGSVIDMNGVFYPMNMDGTPDMNSGVDYEDTSHEFLGSMSMDDETVVNLVMADVDTK